MKNATKTTKKAAKAATASATPEVKAAPAPEAKTKKAAAPKKAAAKKEAAPAASDELAIHINPSGRVCFGKTAAERIGDREFMRPENDGKALRLVAITKDEDGAWPIRRANGRPYISATKEFKAAGLFDGKAADLVAQPYNSHGFELKLA